MANKSKTYTILILVIIGLVFLGIGCTEKGPSPAANTSATGAPAENATAAGTSQNASSGGTQSISVKGSDTILPVAQAEAETFMDESANAGKSISVTGGGSGVGIAALIDKQVDIATASREINVKETENANKNGVNPVEYTIAYDGITAIVNPKNPVSNLTFAQLSGIYTGNISNWKDVGGEDKPIAVISRDSSSGTYAYFKEAVLNNSEYRPDALTQTATGSIVSEVSQNPNAIGYIGFAYLDSSVKALSLDKGNGSVPPSIDNIKSGKYPLSRALYMYTNGEATGLKKEFIDYILSEKGQGVVTTVGYIPLPK